MFASEESRKVLDLPPLMLVYESMQRATIDQIAECERIWRWACVDRKENDMTPCPGHEFSPLHVRPSTYLRSIFFPGSDP